MISVIHERGPWGRCHAKQADIRLADIRIKELADLPDALAAFTLKPA
jgi:hypothetical protein